MAKKIHIIVSGDDAYVEPLILPEGINVDEERKKWGIWYRDVYCKGPTKYKSYISFVDWLKKKGAKKPSKEEVEIYQD